MFHSPSSVSFTSLESVFRSVKGISAGNVLSRRGSAVYVFPVPFSAEGA